MKDMSEAADCKRGIELVAYLYEEATDAEANDLRQHLNTCAACNAEFANFTRIRHSIGQWRQDSLGALLPAADGEKRVEAFSRTKPSAITAIRQFLEWSPIWMKGAVAFATLLFCLLAFLALARLRKPYTPPAVVTNANNRHDIQLQKATENPKSPDNGNSVQRSPLPKKLARPRAKQSTDMEVASAGRRPLTKTERAQLAADLRLTSPGNDAELDLLGDRLTSQE